MAILLQNYSQNAFKANQTYLKQRHVNDVLIFVNYFHDDSLTFVLEDVRIISILLQNHS